MNIVIKIFLYPIFHLILKPLIQKNYKLRAITAICKHHKIPVCTIDGKEYKDEWYWADALSAQYGYFVPTSFNSKLVTRCLQEIK